MRRFEQIVGVIIVGLLCGGFWWLSQRNGGEQISATPSRLPGILKSGQINCSYLIYPPYFIRDPKTGQLTGVFHDLMEDVGQRANLKIVWVEEVGYENIFPGLDSGRYDVFAGGLWPSAARAKAAYFTIPVFYSNIKVWGRASDHRFTSVAQLNSPNVRIATIDGAMEDIIAKADFPNATRVSLPQLDPFSQNLLNITSNKADVTFAEPSIIFEFSRNNPGALRDLFPDQPVRVFGNSLVVKQGDDQLREFLNLSLDELLFSGDVERILKKYEPAPGTFLRVASPYRLAPTSTSSKASQAP